MKKKQGYPAKDYPTWKVRGSPTPCDRLIVCDECGYAGWTVHSTSPVNYHYCLNNKRKRCREATPGEYEAAKKALTLIIGLKDRS